MAHETSVPPVRFMDRLRAEIHAVHHAGDTAHLEFLERLHALSCVEALRNGNLLVADDFAGLAGLVSDLLKEPVGRDLRRPPTEPPAPEEDLQLGGIQ